MDFLLIPNTKWLISLIMFLSFQYETFININNNIIISSMLRKAIWKHECVVNIQCAPKIWMLEWPQIWDFDMFTMRISAKQQQIISMVRYYSTYTGQYYNCSTLWLWVTVQKIGINQYIPVHYGILKPKVVNWWKLTTQWWR